MYLIYYININKIYIIIYIYFCLDKYNNQIIYCYLQKYNYNCLYYVLYIESFIN